MARSYNIAVLPGDGTGPEVVGEGLKVLNAAAAVGETFAQFHNVRFRRRALHENRGGAP